MFDQIRLVSALTLATLLGLGCDTGVEPNGEPPDDGPIELAVSSVDPHYVQAGAGRPLFLLGFGHPLDWYHPTKYADLRTAYETRGLSYLRILLPWSGPDADLVAYTHQRTGPGTALDGGPKFDLTKIDPVFLDRLEDVVSWASQQDIVVAVGLWHDWPFEIESFGLTTDYNWRGSVINPANRINLQAAEVVVRPSGRPDFYDILGLNAGCFNGACWGSQTDRMWLRDVVKTLFDAVLQRLAPYRNWYIELGSRAYFREQSKRYWANYVRGTSHSQDDAAVSPAAMPNVLLIDQPWEPVVGDPPFQGTTVVQQYTLPELGASGALAINESFTEANDWAGQQRVMYDMNVVLMATPEGGQGVIIGPDNRANRRRSAWQALVAGGHYESMVMHGASGPLITPPSSADFLPDFEHLMTFLRTARNGTTIERQLVHMRPDNARIVSSRSIATGPFALAHKAGQTEGYLVFATGGTNPTVTIGSAGLTITRLDAVTGVEDLDPGSPTTDGANVLTSTGNDTAWWITSAASGTGGR